MARQERKSDLGFFNAFLLILILFLPALFAFRHLHQTTSDLLKRAEFEKIDSLEYEMNDFAESLVPGNYIERALEKTEMQLGLRTDLKNNGVEDPELYNKATFEKMLQHLQSNFALKPVVLVGIEHDLKQVHSFFTSDFDSRSAKDKAELEIALAATIVVKVMQRKIHKNLEVQQRLNRLNLKRGLNSFTTDDYIEKKENILKSMFSPVAEFPKVAGSCHEVYTTSFGSQRLYFYTNGSMLGNHIAGGYFIVFAGRNVSCAKILELAKNSDGVFQRKIVRSHSPIEHAFIYSPEQSALIRHLPEPFQSQLSLSRQKLSFSELNNYGLMVSVLNSQLNQKLKNYFQISGFLQRLLLLLTLGAVAFFYFHGFSLKGRLRKKILFIAGLIILLPYILVGYFSGLILDSIEKIRPREVQTAAECKMFEVSQFLSDTRLRRQLVALEAKKRINEALLEDPESLFATNAFKQFVPGTLNNETVSISLPDGRFVLINKERAGRKDSEKFARFFGIKCLNNLGVLEKENENTRREVELANLAAGFLSETKRRYTEGVSLGFEASSIKDVAHMSIFWKMIYFVFSSAAEEYQRAIGMASIFFGEIHNFGECLNQISYDYRNFLRVATPFVKHSFAVGRLDTRGELWIRWPDTLADSNKEKRLLEYVARENFSGSETHQSGRKIQTLVWKYTLRDPHVYAGVTESTPDLWIIYMFNLLPFAGGLFSLLSLFLLADFLCELFVLPVKEFIPALEQISVGEYHTRIQIAKTDELGLLADSFNSMAEGLQQREKMRRFVSEKLMETVAQEASEVDRAQENELSVLVSDIRGFTKLSEKNSPEEIVSLLNDYFTEMEEAIKTFGGNVERFIGDAVVAVFYPSADEENHAQRAVNAALSMRAKLQDLNESRLRQGKFTIENGIGIVTDVALSGVTGEKSGRQVFMIIGSAVIRASELDAITAKFKGNKIAVCCKTASMAVKQSFVAVSEQSDAMRLNETDE